MLFNKYNLAKANVKYKLVVALALIFATASLAGIKTALLSFALALVFAYFSGLKFKAFSPALKAMQLFSIFFFLTIPLKINALQSADVLFNIGVLSYTFSGLNTALLVYIKGNALLIISISFFCSSSLAENSLALLNLGMPEKLVTLIQLVARHIVSFEGQAKRLHNAAKLRGFVASSHPRSWKASAYIISMILVRCLEMTKRTEQAMLLRGFSGKIPLLLATSAPEHKHDKVMLYASLCLAGLLFGTHLFW